MPFVKFDVKREIKKQCDTDPEFKKIWDERNKRMEDVENGNFVPDEKFLKLARREIADELVFFSEDVKEDEAAQIANELVEKIDWNNKALMHKGFSWIAIRYLERNGRKVIY
ncbi:MAG: hypothetical protein UIM53_02840 [Acutalibacteraceae bacterium]|nr:hypothetical protein [Acutalibacteraceae bacterium]